MHYIVLTQLSGCQTVIEWLRLCDINGKNVTSSTENREFTNNEAPSQVGVAYTMKLEYLDGQESSILHGKTSQTQQSFVHVTADVNPVC